MGGGVGRSEVGCEWAVCGAGCVCVVGCGGRCRGVRRVGSGEECVGGKVVAVGWWVGVVVGEGVGGVGVVEVGSGWVVVVVGAGPWLLMIRLF